MRTTNTHIYCTYISTIHGTPRTVKNRNIEINRHDQVNLHLKRKTKVGM